jgi:hypothetical protein
VVAITGSQGQSNGAAGHQAFAFILTNTGSVSCTLEGYPYVQLMNASGSAIATTPIEGNDGVTSISDLPKTVTLAAGGTASFALQYEDVPTGSQTCTAASSIGIYLPGTAFAAAPSPVTISTDIAPCGGIVYVSPVQAGTAPP